MFKSDLCKQGKQSCEGQIQQKTHLCESTNFDLTAPIVLDNFIEASLKANI